MAHYVHRTSRLGAWVLINERWYKTTRLFRYLPVHRLHELYERAQLAWSVPAICIIEMEPLFRRQKLVEYRNDGARGDLDGRELAEDEAEPVALTRRAKHCAHLVENKPAAHVDGHVLAADTKFPLEEPRAI